MAEVIGVVASIAGLFRICVEIFDLIQTGRHQELDLRKLTLRFKIEKARLYIWGKAMGLTEATTAKRQRAFDLCEFKNLVKENLEFIFQTLNDTQKLKDELADTREPGPVEQLTVAFGNFKFDGYTPRVRCSNLVQKTRWMAKDRKKFGSLITEVKGMIDDLEKLTKPCRSAADQTDMMRKAIENIKSVKTLGMVAEVCNKDHPDLRMLAETAPRDGVIDSTEPRDHVTRNKGIKAAVETLTLFEFENEIAFAK